MGKKYLNKNTRFQCGNGNAVWFNPQNGDFKVKINSAEALLDDCRLCLIGGPRPGQCNLVPDPSTGAPGPCTAAIINSAWNNNSSLKVGNKSVLLSNCSVSCPVGGSIKPFNPTIMALNVEDNPRIASISISTIDGTGNEVDNNSLESDIVSNAREENDVSNNQESSDNQESDEENSGVQKVEYALCDYKNCSRAKECEYLKASYTVKESDESKNAAELKINMGKDCFDIYAGDCTAIANSLYGKYLFSVAHHHLIPVNQCFKEYPEIVKLANYYNYNINKAANGICLPTMNDGYDKQPFDIRKDIAFKAMEALGKQWHKGGHEYLSKIKADIDVLLPKPFKHYVDAVDIELISFRVNLNDDVRCRADNYEQQAADFSKKMDKICERVAKKLRKFEDDPKKAYPFFVSKLAFYFAYQEELNGYEEKLF